MLRKHIVITVGVLVLLFIISTNYLFMKLVTQVEVASIHDKITAHLNNLPNVYYSHKPFENDNYDHFIKHLNIISLLDKDLTKLWNTADSWITKNQMVNFNDPHIGSVLLALKTAKINQADLDTRGTQLKLLLTLDGLQQVVFKPKWYDLERVIEGPVYAGKDRYNSEIVSFYLSAMLNMPFAPSSVDRVISFTSEVLPVSSKRLIATSFQADNRTCIYGSCFYCKKQDAICENENFKVVGSVIFNFNRVFKTYKSPWQRTYKKNKTSLWEQDHNYCKYVKEKLSKRRLLDLIDVAIFDFFIQNGDRHHYETFNDNIILIDNGKGFGNPNINHLDILAPLYQCCMLRKSTMLKLLNLAGGQFKRKILSIPQIEKLLTPAHINSLEKRLLMVFATIEYCKNDKSMQ